MAPPLLTGRRRLRPLLFGPMARGTEVALAPGR
jgi:hypothetical protein